LQETPKIKRDSSGGSSERRPAKKQRTDSNASSNNRLGSLSPALNHSTPLRKSGSLLDRPANIARPVSNIFILLFPEIYLLFIYYFYYLLETHKFNY
jgi:hypothetical protein